MAFYSTKVPSRVAGIRATKFYFERVVGNLLLTYKEINILLIFMEPCLNS